QRRRAIHCESPYGGRSLSTVDRRQPRATPVLAARARGARAGAAASTVAAELAAAPARAPPDRAAVVLVVPLGLGPPQFACAARAGAARARAEPPGAVPLSPRTWRSHSPV